MCLVIYWTSCLKTWHHLRLRKTKGICSFYFQYISQKIHSMKYSTIQIIKFNSWWVSAPEWHPEGVNKDKGTSPTHLVRYIALIIIIRILKYLNSRYVCVIYVYAVDQWLWWTQYVCPCHFIRPCRCIVHSTEVMDSRNPITQTGLFIGPQGCPSGCRFSAQ